MDKLLIIGIDGFIGNYFKKHFIKYYDVYGIGLLKEKNAKKYFQINIENKQDVKKVINIIKPNIIINLAAVLSTLVSYSEYDKLYNTNVFGLKNIFESIIEEDINLYHLISFSSCEIYGRDCCNSNEQDLVFPESVYSLTKAMGENISKYFASAYNIPVTIVRPSLIYGEGQKGRFFIFNLINSLLDNVPFNTTFGEQTRDFIHVHDVFFACLEILRNQLFINETVNISFGKSYSLKEVINIAADYVKNTALINLGAIPYRKSEIMNYSISNEKLKSKISTFPTISVEKGLERVIESLKKEKNN